jgi:hypothetical protein
LHVYLLCAAHSTGRFRLLRNYKGMLFHDEEEDEDAAAAVFRAG